MMTQKYNIVIACVFGLSAVHPFFAFAETPELKKITDVAQLSYIDTQGNTDLTTLLVINTFKYAPVDYLIATWKIEALKSSQDGEDTAERYTTFLRVDYNIRRRLYTFADVSWLQDEFAKIDDRYYFGAGLGYKILAGPKHFLDTEAGVNYTMDTYTDDTGNDYAGGRVFGKYAYSFTEKNRFEQSVEYLHDFDDRGNYNINSDTSITSALNSILSLKIGYQVKYDNEPASGAERTDRTMAVAMVVNFL